MTVEPKVLVACPTFSGMGYCLKEWADAYKAFTYENRGALMVDNSDTNLHYLHLIRAQGPSFREALQREHPRSRCVGATMRLLRMMGWMMRVILMLPLMGRLSMVR
jgi:hypothetical protein